ncbi:hypothetical protein HNR23_001372 [Nocardiopsis mwathae]|uniref:Uncharacterized protein n=1 Tax=Nocardiopsis mwathae TaxID=1472723 RepID=A0A7W9YFU5_9ACTN|nr:hypothetical protein [Nocardiopsis mwathae]MBB6171312.1 hypothetical protein [Nocardiopsis mwathae]
MASGLDLRELQVGIFGTRADLHWYLEEIRTLLDEMRNHGSPELTYDLHHLESDEPLSPDEAEEDGMSVAEGYDELPEQWRVEHPNESPGSRTTFEVRVGLLSTEEEADHLVDRLPALICPEEFHKGPCHMPWTSSCHPPAGDADRARLEARYGHLRD